MYKYTVANQYARLHDGKGRAEAMRMCAFQNVTLNGCLSTLSCLLVFVTVMPFKHVLQLDRESLQRHLSVTEVTWHTHIDI